MAQRKVTPFAKLTPWAPVSIPAADESTTDVDDVDRIRMIMAGVLGISEYHEIQVDTDFQSLGLDSLGSIEAQQALGVVLKISVLHDLFTNYTGWSFGGLVAFEAAQRLTARGLVVKGIVLIDSPGP